MALQESVRNLNKAYGRFFKKEAGYPRFKSRRGEQSSYHCTGVSAGDDFVKVPKMKKIKAVMHRKIEGKVKSITLSMDACGDYWASVLYEDGLPEAVPATCVRQTKTVGVDVGIETFGTCSDGEKIKSPKALKRAEKKLKKAQRSFSRKQKGSKNREKARKRLAKLHRKVKRRRSDFLHKTSRRLVIHGQLPVCKCSGDFLGTTPPGGRVHARPPFNTWRSHTTTFGLSRIRVGNSCAESNRQTVVE